MRYRILITDPLHRKTFDVISFFKHRFYDIPLVIGNSKRTLLSRLNLKILYRCNIEQLCVDNEEDFIHDLLEISTKYKNEKLIFIPIEETSIRYFYSFLILYGRRNFVSLLPPLAVFEKLQNKKMLNEYCAYNDISCPRFYPINDLKYLNIDLYPLLLKPCIGSGSKGIIKLFAPKDLSEEKIEIISRTDYLAQELIENSKDVKGAFFLYFKGKFVNAYTHERIRTSPSAGGVTVMSRMSNNQEIIDLGKQLLDKIGWEGLIMLEFLYDSKSKTYKIIEANPRIWGSILLSEYGNANLLSNYVNICLNREIVESKSQLESKIRWLFPVDILNYIKSRFMIKGFWNFDKTCFINWTYSNKCSAIYFNLLSIFNFKNLQRFLRK